MESVFYPKFITTLNFISRTSQMRINIRHIRVAICIASHKSRRALKIAPLRVVVINRPFASTRAEATLKTETRPDSIKVTIRLLIFFPTNGSFSSDSPVAIGRLTNASSMERRDAAHSIWAGNRDRDGWPPGASNGGIRNFDGRKRGKSGSGRGSSPALPRDQ